jgi:hypothetical protein
LIELTEKQHFALDRPKNSILNSLMSCQKGNIFLLRAIRQIVENVKNKYYGTSPLSPTGPEMLGLIITKNYPNITNNIIDLIHYQDGGYIIYKNTFVISTEYPEYKDEQANAYKSINLKRYNKLWEERSIYA